MSDQKVDHQSNADELYEESGQWTLNTGDETIHAKRMPGKFRSLKWLTMSVWLVFFFGPYLRWGDRQAVLFDIPNRQFHIFELTILPQDVWMLSLVLLFFAILLAVVTSIAGRVFCGYFCFQTIWTDIFTWIEDKLEGNPAKRRKLDKEPFGLAKLKVKLPKHVAWLVISMLTGISFAAWFTDAFKLWHDYLTLSASTLAWAVLGAFTVGTYVLAGFMREQVCFWLCPYARIQGVMYDRETILPAYDFKRGEKRGRLIKGKQQEGHGDCVDCNQCVAVCPTGVDIRTGQHEGCITCALCIDACDSVMEKIGKPKGLIRYACLDELEGKPTKPFYKRARPLVYITIMILAASGIIYGLANMAGIELKVLHERQPLYIQQTDGSIMNKYYFKVLNKTNSDQTLSIRAVGIDGLELRGISASFNAVKGDVSSLSAFVHADRDVLTQERTDVIFQVLDSEGKVVAEYASMFFGPTK